MTYLPHFLTNKNNLKLRVHDWNIPDPIAYLFIVHGFAEHGYRYSPLAKYLNSKGIRVIAFDLHGHGESEGIKAYVSRFDDYLDDVDLILNSYESDLPRFLFGHSMGGLISCRYCFTVETNHLAGLITSGAALKLDDDLSPILLKIVPILSWIFPKLPTQPLDKTYLTRSPENMNAYLNDPLIYLKGIRARTAAELIKAIESTAHRFKDIRLPILAMHGTGDKLTDPEGTVSFYEKASSKDKSLKLYKGLYHELVNEPEKDIVMKDIGDWIATHL